MTKIEEIIEREFGLINNWENVDAYRSAFTAMTEYAEIYARKVLEIAAEEAYTDYDSAYNIIVCKDSILNIKLPEHE